MSSAARRHPTHVSCPTTVGGRLVWWCGRRGMERGDAARVCGYLLAPVIVPQGIRLLRTIPRLPEASGARTGRVTGDGAGAPITLLVHGESTAVGVGVASHNEALAGNLARLFAAAHREVTWAVSGQNGARARGGRKRRRPVPLIEGRFDLVVIALGVNDTLGRTSIARWRSAMARISGDALDHLEPGGRVVLAGVPRIDRFPALPMPLRWVMGQHARALDGVLAQLSDADPRLTHVPTPPMVDDLDLADDGFHPSAAGYARWARHLRDTLADE